MWSSVSFVSYEFFLKTVPRVRKKQCQLEQLLSAYTVDNKVIGLPWLKLLIYLEETVVYCGTYFKC